MGRKPSPQKAVVEEYLRTRGDLTYREIGLAVGLTTAQVAKMAQYLRGKVGTDAVPRRVRSNALPVPYRIVPPPPPVSVTPTTPLPPSWTVRIRGIVESRLSMLEDTTKMGTSAESVVVRTLQVMLEQYQAMPALETAAAPASTLPDLSTREGQEKLAEDLACIPRSVLEAAAAAGVKR